MNESKFGVGAERVILALLIVGMAYQQYQILQLQPVSAPIYVENVPVVKTEVLAPLILEFGGTVVSSAASSVTVAVDVPADPRGVSKAIKKNVVVKFTDTTLFQDGEKEKMKPGATFGFTSLESIADHDTVTATRVFFVKS